jgi:hypothetical protein
MRGRLVRNQIDEGMLAACICMSIYEVCSFPHSLYADHES